MGFMRFLVPQNHLLPRAIETAYVRGLDELPWLGKVSLTGNELVVERENSESGYFQILWSVEGHGTLLLSTPTLIERPEPYSLPVELARGTLNRLRNQVALYEGAGMTMSEAVNGYVEAALHEFVKACTNQDTPDAAAEHAQRSIGDSLWGIDAVCTAVAERFYQTQLKQTSRTLPLFGCRLRGEVPHGEDRRAFVAAFNTVVVPFSWGRIEADQGRQKWSAADALVQWCQKRGLRIAGGPLLELERRSLPDWLFLWEGDFDNLLSVAADHLRAVVGRYKGKVSFWNVAGRLISGEALGLDEEQKLRLAGQAIEVVRTADGQTPIVVSIDQPWGEFLAHRESDLTPLHFADALVRSDLGLSGIAMEINLGTSDSATLPRDRFEFAQLIERWTVLGMPLLFNLSVPSAGDGFTPEAQRAWYEKYVPTLLSRSVVQGFFVNQLFDGEADDFPGTGLFDSAGAAKPALDALPALRKQFSA